MPRPTNKDSLSARLASLRAAIRSKGYGRGYRIVGRKCIHDGMGDYHGDFRTMQSGTRNIARAAQPGDHWWIEIVALIGPEQDCIIDDLDWHVSGGNDAR